MQAKALIPISGRVVILVARLKADRALVLSNMPSSVNPADLLSTKEKYFIKSRNEQYVMVEFLFSLLQLFYCLITQVLSHIILF